MQPRLPEQHRLVVIDELASTNSEALRLASVGEIGPLWVMARRQSAGRGRSGRVWIGEEGNLFTSLLLDLACPPAIAHQLSLVAGLASHGAVCDLAAASGVELAGQLRLKWPNDLLLDGAKFAGILVETVSAAPGHLKAVVGIGINLTAAPRIEGRAVTSLAAKGLAVAPETMLAHLANAFARQLALWQEGRGFAQVRTAWLKRAGPLGETMNMNAGGVSQAGRYAGLDDNGALLMTDDNGTELRFTFGDVTLP